MSLKQIHKTLVFGRFSVIIGIVIAILMRLIARPAWSDYSFWITLSMQIGIALILLQINHTFTIIRSKTMLPALLYLLFSGSSPALYTAYQGSIAAFAILLCLMFLLDSYQEPESQKNALNIALILTISSLLWPPLLFFFPFIWYGFYRFRCLNFKTFFATIIGILTIYFFILSWSLYKNDLSVFLNFLPKKDNLLVFHAFSFTPEDWAVLAYLFILFIISGVSIYSSELSEKIRTSVFLHYLYLISVCIFILLLIQSEWKFNWTLILYVPLTFILSHYFTLSTKKITAGLLLFTLIFFAGMYVWQLIQ